MPAKVNRSAKPPEQMSVWSRWAGYLFFTALLVGALAVYVKLGRDSELAGTLPLPAPLKTVSPAHEDLMLYGRALNELATEAGNRLPEPENAIRLSAHRFLSRAAHLHVTGRELEPRLTREERRILATFTSAEKLITQYISGQGEVPYDQGLIKQAKQELAIGFELGRGKDFDQLVLGRKHRADTPGQKREKLTGDFTLLSLPMDE